MTQTSTRQLARRLDAQTRQSRLVRSIPSFLILSIVTIVRFYTMYRPLRVFVLAGGTFIAGGIALGLRFLYLFWQTGGATGNIQSLILAAILIIVGFQICLIGLIADMVQLNRKLAEEALFRMRRLELNAGEREDSVQ